jgi:hypothetical protein
MRALQDIAYKEDVMPHELVVHDLRSGGDTLFTVQDP